MNDHFPIKRRKHAPCRPQLEGMESRRLLAAPATASVVAISGAALAVVQTTPAPGAVLDQFPTDLVLRFNRTFDPDSLGSDVVLERVGDDGTATPLDASFLSEPTSLPAPTDTLDVAVDRALPPGHYRIALAPGATIDGLQGQPLVGAGTALADFQVRGTGVTLAGATALGTPGTTPIEVASTLDPRSDAGEARLYQFTLPAGPSLWTLGAEVSAQRDGSPLVASLVLLDAQGHVIKAGDSGRGDAPADPYLFAGLGPGTYYLGVSLAGDLPGRPGGYDPVAGLPGSFSLQQPGGPFRLDVAAVPAQPTTVTGFQLVHADPADPRPTGFTVAFSGPLDLDSLLGPPAFRALQVVDASGTAWPITATAGSAGQNTFSFVFNRPLPAGHYTLIVPATGGAADLAGQPPSAPGQPAGVLASWDVAPASNATAAGPTDLGTIFPTTGDRIAPATTIAPGATVDYRFVATIQGFYHFSFRPSGGAVSIERDGPDGVEATQTAAADATVPGIMFLQPGVYHLRFTNPGTRPVRLSLGLGLTPGAWESTLMNGVGQGPALDLILVAPPSPNPAPAAAGPAPDVPTATSTPVPVLLPAPATSPDATAGPAPSFPAATAGAATPARSVGPTNAPAPVATTGPATLPTVLTLGGVLVGGPNPQADHVAAVGPGSSNAIALAVNETGLLQGINYGAWPAPRGESDGPSPPPDARPGLVLGEDGSLDLADVSARPGPDEQALALGEWLGRIGPEVRAWLSPTPAEGAGPERTVEALGTEEASRGAGGAIAPDPLAPALDDASDAPYEAVERADLAAPIGVVVAAVGALRLRGPLRQWLGARRGEPFARRKAPHRHRPRRYHPSA